MSANLSRRPKAGAKIRVPTASSSSSASATLASSASRNGASATLSSSSSASLGSGYGNNRMGGAGSHGHGHGGGNRGFDEAWNKLATAIQEIHKKNASVLSFEELYRNAYNMVLHKNGDKLYNGVKQVISAHLQSLAQSELVPVFPTTFLLASSGKNNNSNNPNPNGATTTSIPSNLALNKSIDLLATGTDITITDSNNTLATTTSTNTFLKVLKHIWEEHTICMGMIKDILMYVDRVYVKNNQLVPIYDMGLDIFSDVVIHSPMYPIQQYLVGTLLYHIRLERQGEVVDRGLLKATVEMLRELSSSYVSTPTIISASSSSSSSSSSSISKTTYDTDFEPKFLDTSRQFYKHESQTLLSQCTVPQYLAQVTSRLTEESTRTKHYLPTSTEPKIRSVLESELITPHITTLLYMESSGLVDMLENARLEDLKRLYELFGRVETGHEEMRKLLNEHLRGVGRKLNEMYAVSFSSSNSNSSSGGGGSGSSAIKKSDSTSSVGSTDSTGPAITVTDGNANAKEKANTKDKEKEKEKDKETSPFKWVESMIELCEKYRTILTQSFQNDKSFETQLTRSLEWIINDNRKSPECLSLFMDDKLRKGLKGKTEEEISALLDKAIQLFRYISEKDIFERYYKQHLAKRLLSGKCLSEDTEKSVIAKLRLECGYQFTTKMEGMFHDMRTSEEFMADFKNYLVNSHLNVGGGGDDDSDVDGETASPSLTTATSSVPELQVSVLTSTFWPLANTALSSAANNNAVTMDDTETINKVLNQTQSCNYPPILTTLMTKYTRYYLSRHSGRRLTWLPNMGSADLKAVFEKGRKEINVSTYGMIVLLTCFNRDDLSTGKSASPMSYSQIHAETDIPHEELKRTLQSLSLGKYKILLRKVVNTNTDSNEKRTKEISDTDLFIVNKAFAAPLNKIKIPTITLSSSTYSSNSASSSATGNAMETEVEARETLAKIEETRKHQIEAAIVRVMKDRKTLEHHTLVTEVVKLLSSRFLPTPAMVKKRIEGLIDREFLERDSTDRKLYRYLA